MNSQNRMNAGAEYVLCRIWAALQDRNGVHAESLLTCIGALAGYACQVCVRQTGALPGADARTYALKAMEARDGATYLHGDALRVLLAESPLSIWALVGRTVQKLGEPLPDIEDIFRHVTQTLGTGAFGVPRVSDGPRPCHSAMVYLRQVWPQILPIAQKFCRKPAELPVLFGIALQRAIEETRDLLSPTLGASIAMECAVAMSKVALPGAEAIQPTVTGRTAMATAVIAAAPRPMPSPSRAPPASARRRRGREEASARGIGTLVARVPAAARLVAIGSLAFVTIAGAMYGTDPRQAPKAAREVGAQQSQNVQEDTRVVGQPTPEAQPGEEAQRLDEAPHPEEAVPPDTRPAAPAEDVIPADSPLPLDPNADGSAEIVIRDDPDADQN